MDAILEWQTTPLGIVGVDGTAASLDSGSPYMFESEFQKAKEFQPNIVIIMLGTNDANAIITPNNGGFVSSYMKLVEEFKHFQPILRFIL